MAEEITIQSSAEFWQSFALVVGDVPPHYLSAFEPTFAALGVLALGSENTNPAQLLVACRRLTHGLAALEWFKASDSGTSQWEAEQRFGAAVLALRAATDNCGHFLTDLYGLGLKPNRVDVGYGEFREAVRTHDSDTGADLDKIADSLSDVTTYRHATAHRAFPRVLFNGETKRLVVPKDATLLDPAEHWIDRASEIMLQGLPAVEVLEDAVSVSRLCIAASSRAAVRWFERSGQKAPRQPTPAEFGRAALQLMITGDYHRPDTGEVMHAYMKAAAGLYPPSA